jgi:branched-chain amino acid transport system substrate-binding protein
MAAPGSQASVATSLRIGTSLALTGPESVYATQLRHAIDLAIEDARAEMDVAIDLVVEDDHADADMAAGAAMRLVDSEAVAIVGPMNSWTCERQGPIFAHAGLVQITPSASNPVFSRCRWPGFFRMCPSDLEQARVLAWVARELTRSRAVAAVHDGTAFAEPLASAFVDACRQLGLETGPVACVAMGRPSSYAGAAGLVAAAAPDAVFVAGLEEPCAQTARALRAAGSSAVFLGTDGIKPTNALVTPGHDRGPYLTNAGMDARHTAPDFHRRFEARFGAHHSIYTVEAYDAVRLLAAAALAARPPGRAGILQAVRAMRPFDSVACEVAQGKRPFDSVASGLAQRAAIQFDAFGERVAPALGVYRWDGTAIRFVCSRSADR